MALFWYNGLDAAGRTETGEVEGRDEAEAFAVLQARGIAAFELKEAGQGGAARVPWYARDIQLGRSGHKLADQAAVAELMGLLAGLGLSATEMIAIAAENAPTAGIRRHLKRMQQGVADGQPLSRAFAGGGDGFAPVFGQVLGVAEAGNTLPTALADLARMLRRTERVRGRVGAALIYPAILLVAAILLMGVIAVFLAPALAPMFEALDRPMPAFLGFLQGAGAVLTAQSVWVLPVVLVVLGGAVLGLVVPQWQPARARVLQGVPLVGPIMREGRLLRHVAALGMLLRGSMPLPEALEGAAAMDQSSPYAASFAAGADSLRQGRRALEGMREAGGLPSLVLSLLAAGEEANQMSRSADTLADVLEQSVETRITKAMQLLTPALTLLIGGIIGGIVFAVMSAILDVNTGGF